MCRILSIDDNALIREFIHATARAMGHDCLEAENGRQGLEVLAQSHPQPDLILLDVDMPEMDGFAVLYRVKSDARFKSIPVMMVTSRSEREDVEKGLRSGATDYMFKPFTGRELREKLKFRLASNSIHPVSSVHVSSLRETA